MKTTIDNVTIITNNIPRETIFWCDLSNKERKEFDYINTDEKQGEALFVRYNGWIYDISEFMRIQNIKAFKGWDGYTSDTYFSGILIKFVEDGDPDYVIMGHYYS